MNPDQKAEETAKHWEAIFYAAMWVVNGLGGAQEFTELVEEIKKAHAADMIEGTRQQALERVYENHKKKYLKILFDDFFTPLPAAEAQPGESSPNRS